jgi:DNA-binding CsgD family transcriptional regulator
MAMQGLTRRESEIMVLVCSGKSNNQISQNLDISINTLKTHLKHIFKKLNAQNRTDATMKYLASIR